MTSGLRRQPSGAFIRLEMRAASSLKQGGEPSSDDRAGDGAPRHGVDHRAIADAPSSGLAGTASLGTSVMPLPAATMLRKVSRLVPLKR